MPTYDHFARYYDALMDDPLANVRRVLGYRERHMPTADSLLELGCGSGSILAGLQQFRSLVGLDRSPQMLATARRKVPRARFVQADMTTFELGERFDIVICVFDTLNHLVSFDAWCSLFERVRAHLRDGGLFVFDVNTVGQLRRLGDAPAWVLEVAGATITQEVEWRGAGQSIWHVRIDERSDGDRPSHHHERIGELGVELTTIADALAGDFVLLESCDEDGSAPTDESARAYFAYRARDSARPRRAPTLRPR
jgi:SAM-dependent methyltransferase